MNHIASVYILTGFLDSGKTTLLSRLIKKCQKKKLLVIQFEEGEEELEFLPLGDQNYKHLIYSKQELDTEFDEIRDTITAEIEHGKYDEIWIEWNGMETFSKLEKILLQCRMQQFLHIEKVMYLADILQADFMLGQTGEPPISQIAASDVVFLRNAKDPMLRKKFIQKVKAISPSIEAHGCTMKSVCQALQKENGNSIFKWIGQIALIGILISLVHMLSQWGIPLMKIFTDLIRKPRPFRGDFAIWLEIFLIFPLFVFRKTEML